MALVLPFKAVRPDKKFASQVAALPYDVMTREEAQKAVAGNALSFMHVEKSEIDVPDGTRSDDKLIYQTAKNNFTQMLVKGILLQDTSLCFYVYRQKMGGRSQTGIVGTMSAAEYDAGKIKKHELTRKDKEEDRINHVSTVNAQTGPVFISYRERPNINKIVDQITAGAPEYDFTADDGIIHTAWVVADVGQIEDIKKEFSQVDALYIADGHHRAQGRAGCAEAGADAVAVELFDASVVCAGMHGAFRRRVPIGPAGRKNHERDFGHDQPLVGGPQPARRHPGRKAFGRHAGQGAAL